MKIDSDERFSAFERSSKGELMLRISKFSEAGNLVGGDFENKCNENFG